MPGGVAGAQPIMAAPYADPGPDSFIWISSRALSFLADDVDG